MSEERTGEEVTMDEYMKVVDYRHKDQTGVVKQANMAEYAKNAEILLDDEGKPTIFGKDVIAIRQIANNAQTTANEAKTGVDNKVDKIEGKQLSTNDYTIAEKAKLAEIEAGANNYTHPATHLASMIEGLPEVTQTLGNETTKVPSEKAVKDAVLTVENRATAAQETANNAQASATQAQGTATEAAVTAAEAKHTATAAQTTANEAKTGLNGKVDKIEGKQLSTNDYTSAEKEKLAGIEAGVNKYIHPATHPANMITGLPEVTQILGNETTKVPSEKAVKDALNAKIEGIDRGDVEPIGAYKFFAGEMLPEGYLWCNGGSYPANGDYKKLFDAIGTRYNMAGDTEGTFRVPDMRGRVGVGKNAGTFNVLGKIGGEEAHALTEAEMPVHTVKQAPHAHNVKYVGADRGLSLNSGGLNYGLPTWNTNGAGSTGNNGDIITNTITAANNPIGGGQSHNNIQPYLVCNYIIRYARSYGEIGIASPPCIWEIKISDWHATEGGGYKLNIPASKHRRGEYCVLTALYDTSEAGKFKEKAFGMEKNAAGDIAIFSDGAFPGQAYIDRVHMQPAGRVLTVNEQVPDMSGNVNVFEEPIVLGCANYGKTLPATAKEGQLFFLIEE